MKPRKTKDPRLQRLNDTKRKNEEVQQSQEVNPISDEAAEAQRILSNININFDLEEELKESEPIDLVEECNRRIEQEPFTVESISKKIDSDETELRTQEEELQARAKQLEEQMREVQQQKVEVLIKQFES